ncbi:aldehyde dehydrogenase family 2 member C4-like isoform X2 [Phalaenopsis equestris]|uniref:aldehyde dehydrogenase family 2 member C4-like isoform X2 n=1 Tax=Phalaenopsis equestris TaxID=78828 RepID=UPI0009E20491|nr:aldehyde dehydrogenase family 2 member C4-like isoform X2 [Phalaenopsis equestris]
MANSLTPSLTFETKDPRNEEVITVVAEGDKDDIDSAVKAARTALDSGAWPRMSGYERGRIMMKYADLIEEHAEELAILDTIDGGKVFSICKNIDIPHTVHLLRYYAGAADKIHGETLKLLGEFQGYTLKEPLGVIGHIIPWNFPSTLFFVKVSPALAAGCTMIVKPAEQTPLSALYYAHLAKQAGIPDGVLNVVTGFGSTAGAALCSHMDVDKVSFTGSTEVGRLVMEAAAKSNLKHVSLELGGKTPLIIFDDADLDMAVNLSQNAAFFNKGEICVAGSRVYVQEGIYDAFVEKSVEMAKSRVVGDPFNSEVHQGPQIDKKQFEKVLKYIEYGKNEGATLLTGGKTCGDKGYFIEPTIFADVNENMKIGKDEIFGPVLSLMKFKTIEEAIEKANATRYGLAAGIITNNLNIAHRVSRSVQAGTIWINCFFVFDPSCPFGGYKMSGFGKDQGLDAIEKYLNVKSIITPIYSSPWL